MDSYLTHFPDARLCSRGAGTRQSGFEGFDKTSHRHLARSIYSLQLSISLNRAARKQSSPFSSQFKYLTGASEHDATAILDSADTDRDWKNHAAAPTANIAQKTPAICLFHMRQRMTPSGLLAQVNGGSGG